MQFEHGHCMAFCGLVYINVMFRMLNEMEDNKLFTIIFEQVHTSLLLPAKDDSDLTNMVLCML